MEEEELEEVAFRGITHMCVLCKLWRLRRRRRRKRNSWIYLWVAPSFSSFPAEIEYGYKDVIGELVFLLFLLSSRTLFGRTRPSLEKKSLLYMASFFRCLLLCYTPPPPQYSNVLMKRIEGKGKERSEEAQTIRDSNLKVRFITQLYNIL